MNKKTKSTLVDIFALNSFSFVITLPNELIIAGLETDEWIATRLLNLGINTFLGGLYTPWREKIFNLTQTNEISSVRKKYLTDTLTYGTFQLPLYALSMGVAGADLEEVLRGSIAPILTAGATGRPYGLYLDFLRNKFLGKD